MCLNFLLNRFSDVSICRVFLGLIFLFIVNTHSATVTPAVWLQNQPKPVFKSGHTLLPLATMSCAALPTTVQANLAASWGYGITLTSVGSGLDNTLVALANADTVRYKVATSISNLANVWRENNYTPPASAWLHKADGSLVDGRQLLSPEAPDECFMMIVDEAIRRLDNVQKVLKSPIDIIQNWTEYFFATPADVAWWSQQDPSVVQKKGSLDWQDYVSMRRAHYESLMVNAIKAKWPKCFYTAYTYAGVIGRRPYDYNYEWKYMKNVSTDLPSPECYYNYYNAGFTGGNTTTPNMIDTRFTNFNNAQTGVSVEIYEGTPNFYGWVSAGYQRNITDYWGDPSKGMYADMPRWLGYLKVLYTAGMLGATTTGEFGCLNNMPTLFDPFNETTPPPWLTQMTVLGHAHALFSWIEQDLRNSDLLPGPWTKQWPVEWGAVYAHHLPLYEFAVNSASAPTNTHVFARKVKNVSKWIVCAWAADGVEKDAAVNIPDLGAYTIRARACGTVMLVTKTGTTVTSQWYDENVIYPSHTAAALNGVAVKNGSIVTKNQRLNLKVVQNANSVEFLLPGTLQGPVSISISNVSGKHIKQLGQINNASGKSSLCWNTATQSAGIYVARIKYNGPMSVHRLVLGK